MVRILRAFAWLRWRMLLNSLERTGARDAVERFSLAIENLGPIMAAVLMIPSGLVLAIAGVACGYALADGNERPIAFEAARYLLIGVPVFSIIGPLLMPAADRTNPVRLLLLPIPRRVLYVAQTCSALGDVWVLVMLPFVLFVPVGMLAAGGFTAALIAAIAAALLVTVVIGISSVATSVLHLAVRDRGRGELLALLFLVLVPAVSMMPGLLHGSGPRARGEERIAPQVEVRVPAWIATAAAIGKQVYPSELYIASTRSAARVDVGSAAAGIASLALTAVALHAFGMFVFGQVLASPGSSGGRRQAGSTRGAWARRVPGLSAGGSAVAIAQVRLALRTPRGRAILLSPVVSIGIFGLLLRRHADSMDFGPFALTGGLSLAMFGSFISLISILPIAMNQFAIDRAGLTLALLSPLTDREYLSGKAVGNGLIAAVPAMVCVLVSLAIFPGGSGALWIAIPLGLLSTYLLVAPAAAVFSAVFPRIVDLNSIGRGSNAHGLAGLLGLVTFVGAAVPAVLLTLVASSWLDRPALVPVLLLAWCVAAYAIGRALFVAARRIFARRRENLALIL
jgi:hypothetical protein